MERSIVSSPSIPRKERSISKKRVPDEAILANPGLVKYWNKRYYLFSKFDQGIKMDAEAWYSVSPECVAWETAVICKSDTVVDGFCGVGGNTIQFAAICKKVIAIDIDPKKIEMARHNAKIYGVEHKIEFVVDDFFQASKTIKGDVVFLAPPWGGPSYSDSELFDLETMLEPRPMSKLMEAAKVISRNIAAFLPKSSNYKSLMKPEATHGEMYVMEHRKNGRTTALTLYFGDLAGKARHHDRPLEDTNRWKAENNWRWQTDNKTSEKSFKIYPKFRTIA